MKTLIALSLLLTLTGCASLDNLEEMLDDINRQESFSAREGERVTPFLFTIRRHYQL